MKDVPWAKKFLRDKRELIDGFLWESASIFGVQFNKDSDIVWSELVLTSKTKTFDNESFDKRE